jgi:site-specific DNA recombinase
MRVTIYARYSSDRQREASIEDQVRLCEERAAREGWRVVKRYADHAISGASLIRRGIQALMQDAQSGKFDLLLTESLDRISRDQEDIAGVYKRLRFAGVKIYTLSEGEIAELHIGFTGTMSALYLKSLGEKTWRGQSGRVLAGKSGGGNCYGYDVTTRLSKAGEPERGDRSVNEKQAAIVSRLLWRRFQQGLAEPLRLLDGPQQRDVPQPPYGPAGHIGRASRWGAAIASYGPDAARRVLR